MSLVDSSTVIRKPDPDVHLDRMGRLRTALGSGAHPSTAAAYAGISPATLSRWIDEGVQLRDLWEKVQVDPDDHREPSVSEMELIWIAREVEKAEASAEFHLADRIHEASLDDWKAAAWILERRFKERWARRSEVTGAEGGALEIESIGERREMVLNAVAKVAEHLGYAEEKLEGGKAEVVSIERERRDEEDDGQEASGSSS